jgi:SPP1 gp7 family putative phage head morphogenesis protein
VRLPFRFRRDGDIYDVAEQFRLDLLRKEQQAVDAINRAYRAAEIETDRGLNQITDKILRAEKAGRPVKLAWQFQQNRFEQLLSQISIQIARASGTALDVTKAHQLANAILADQGVKAMLTPHLRTSFVGMDHRAFESMTGFLTDGSPLHTIFSQLGKDAVSEARKTFAAAMAGGINPRTTGSVLAKQIAGLPHQRAVLIARTETMRAYRDSQHLSYQLNRKFVTGWRWLCARDGRCCPICIAMDGTTHSPDERFGSHPGCRCTTTPVLLYGDQSLGLGTDWFERQSESYQRQALLTPGRYQMWKDGEASLPEMVQVTHSEKWGTGRRLKTLAELRGQ